MYCKQCGEELNNPKSVICVKCGTSKGNGNNYCGECGIEVKNKEAEICLNCGCRLNNISITDTLKEINRTSKPIGNSKMIAGLLALFLGGLGIHRFYLGYKKIGFIQLIICIVAMFIFVPIVFISWAWAIYDAVKIFTGKLDGVNGEKLV